MTQMISPDAFARTMVAKRLYLAGFGGEPTAVIEALGRRAETLTGVIASGVWIPGVNRIDLRRTLPGVSFETFFVGSSLRPAFDVGQVLFRPMHYSAIYEEYSHRRDIELAVARVSPPLNGYVSLGTAHDFTPALLAAGVPFAGMVDPATPFVADGITVAVSRLAALVDGPSPPVTLPVEPDRAALKAIAQNAAVLVRDGDVVQTGLGSAPNAVLQALGQHKTLTLHGGMVTDAGLALLDAGVVLRVTAGVAMCTGNWLQRLETDRRIAFRDVRATHSSAALAKIDNLVAINSALEVDLFGQINGEMIAGRQISGHGGLADFVRGARLSPAGRSIIVLGAKGERGAVSRIVPVLRAGTPVAVTRGDIDTIVTEFGVAHIRDTDIDTRAARLIAVAAPEFRDDLAVAWDELRRKM
jgi:acyl-CoA hydrolase